MIKVKIGRSCPTLEIVVKVVEGHWGCWKVGSSAKLGGEFDWILANLFDDLTWTTNNCSWDSYKRIQTLEGTYWTITVIDKKKRHIKMEIVYEQPNLDEEEYFKELRIIEVVNFGNHYKAGDIIPDEEMHKAKALFRKFLLKTIHNRVGKHITLDTNIERSK